MEVVGDYKELVLLAALVVWALARRRTTGPWYPWLGVLLLASIVAELMGKWFAAYGLNNHVLYNAYFVVEFGVIMVLLCRTWPRSQVLHRMIAGAVALLFPVLVLDLWLHGSVHVLVTNALIIGGFLIGILAAKALFMLVQESDVALHRLPLFWVLLSFMVYYLTFIPIFGLYNYLSQHESTVAFELSNFNNVLFLIRYGLVLVGLVMLCRQSAIRHDGQ